MPVTLFCPVCNVKVDVPDRLAGKSAPCPVCRTLIDIPAQDRTPPAERFVRRMLAAAPWLVASLVFAALLVETWVLAGLMDDNNKLVGESRLLRQEVRSMKDRLTAMETGAAAPPAPAPVPAAPLTPDERAALQRKIADLSEAVTAQILKLREAEAEIARLKGEAVSPGAAPELAADADIETKVNVKTDTSGPRVKFTFEGRATNTGKRPAPLVIVNVGVTQFQGLHPLTNDVVTFVPHAETLTERLRNLGPGETRSITFDLMPTEPGLLRRDVTWMPVYSLEAKVSRE